MSKTKTIFVCQNCGQTAARWAGRCPGCDSWNTLVEEIRTVERGGPRRGAGGSTPVILGSVRLEEEPRRPTGIAEFDRVLGGGIVPGSVVLIGGDPGIGKSTLALQMTAHLSRAGVRCLYVSGEESIRQTKLRADRLGEGFPDELYIVNELNVEAIRSHVETLGPRVVVVDSIQVVYHPELTSSPGSVSQVRECAAALTRLAKEGGAAVFVIGHVTKDGAIAGPRVLEHIVDTVLYFEGERFTAHRLLRGIKNRFGSTNELGVFEMTASGLREVANPSEIFLAERPHGASGSVVVPILEGTRPFLVEIQGLVTRSSFGMARQKAQGYDANRLAMLVAVLENRLGMHLQDRDVFLNVVGGFRVLDPAADLSVATAVASALLARPVDFETAVLGEVGLSAEVRSVSQISWRINEAAKLGFRRCVVPANNLKGHLTYDRSRITLVPVATVREGLDAACPPPVGGGARRRDRDAGDG